MKTYQYAVVIEPDEDQFQAYVPSLPGCHTFGATVGEAQRNVQEAIELHIEGMREDGEPIPAEAKPLTIPVHAGRIIPIGTLHAILRDANLSAEEFRELLK